MNKTAKVILALLVVTAAASAAFLLLRPKDTVHPVARVTLDGELVEELTLTEEDAR